MCDQIPNTEVSCYWHSLRPHTSHHLKGVIKLAAINSSAYIPHPSPIIPSDISFPGRPIQQILCHQNDFKRLVEGLDHPIQYSGSKTVAPKYWPISLILIRCTVLECLIRDVVTGYLHHHDLLNDLQHSFLSRRSCCSFLLSTVGCIKRFLNAGEEVDHRFLDFK